MELGVKGGGGSTGPSINSSLNRIANLIWNIHLTRAWSTRHVNIDLSNNVGHIYTQWGSYTGALKLGKEIKPCPVTPAIALIHDRISASLSA